MKRFINIYTDEMVTQIGTLTNGDVHYRKDNPVIIIFKTSSGIVKRIDKIYRFVKPKNIFNCTHQQVN